MAVMLAPDADTYQGGEATFMQNPVYKQDLWHERLQSLFTEFWPMEADAASLSTF